MLVMVACSCVNISSAVRAEETPAPADPSATLADQAAAAGIGARIVNGVKVFHTRDGQDLRMCTRWDGSDGVVYDGEVLTVERMLTTEFHPQMGTEIPASAGQKTVNPMSVPTINPVCYSQKYSVWAGDTVGYGPGTMQTVGCYVTSAAMEVATYGGYLNGSLANPRTTNTWLKTVGGFPGNDDNIDFSVISKFPGSLIGGTEYSQDYPSYDPYWRAMSFIAATVPQHPEYKASLPIMKMHRPASPAHPVEVKQHMCAWYSSDGSHTAASNLIVQPAKTAQNDSTLKCSADPSSNDQYLAVTDTTLMRVGWKK